MKSACAIISAMIAAAVSTLPAIHAAASEPVAAPSSFYNRWGATTRAMLGHATGYIPAGDKVAIGPVSSFLGYNTLEGWRIGAGAVTTAGLSSHFRLGCGAAYGFKDRRWKYAAEALWAITPAKGYFGSYPVNTLGVSTGFDTYPLGAEMLSVSGMTPQFRVSLRRNIMILYRRHASMTYTIEPTRRLSIRATVARERIYDTRYIGFGDVSRLDAWRSALQASWTPGGDFFQAATRRIDTRPYAVRMAVRLQWIKGIGRHGKGTPATDLAIAEFAAAKLTPIGFGNMTIALAAHSAISFGHGAYPFTASLPSSPYVINRLGDFALIRPLEIAAGRYVDLHARLDDGGMALGLIPAIRPLGISLTATASAAAGEPWHNTSMSAASLSWSKPYAEAGLGLDHILGIGRIEYVWRLNYRSLPGARRSGIALGIDLKF